MPCDRDTELLVGGPTHRPGHRCRPLLVQPRLGGVEERTVTSSSSGASKNPNRPSTVPDPVDMCGDATDRASTPPRQQVGGVAPVEVRVPPGVESPGLVRTDAGMPAILPAEQEERDVGEPPELGPGLDRFDGDDDPHALTRLDTGA